MTVQRTREIFGEKLNHYTDEQVVEFIANMGLVCDKLLDDIVYQLTADKNDGNTKLGI